MIREGIIRKDLGMCFYLFLIWSGVPRHLNLPWDIIAIRVHKNSHSSIEWDVKTTAEFPIVICFWIRRQTSLFVTASMPLYKDSQLLYKASNRKMQLPRWFIHEYQVRASNHGNSWAKFSFRAATEIATLVLSMALKVKVLHGLQCNLDSVKNVSILILLPNNFRAYLGR